MKVVEFTLFGQPFMAISAGPLDPFNHAISFMVQLRRPGRDRSLLERAPRAAARAEQCGWLKDRYGVSWQIVPAVLGDMIADPDRDKAQARDRGDAEDGEARHRRPAGGVRRSLEFSRARLSRMTSARDALDRVHSLAHLEAFRGRARCGRGAARRGGAGRDDNPDLEARDALFADTLTQVDAMIARAMRLRLDHELAADSSIGAPTRNVFALTIVSYLNRLSLLEDRARDIATRGRSPDPERIAAIVVESARRALDLRDVVRGGVLDVIRQLALAAVPEADQRARDRKRPDLERKRWSAARRDLEAVAVEPERVLSAPLSARLVALPVELDEPPAEPEKTFKDLLELD